MEPWQLFAQPLELLVKILETVLLLKLVFKCTGLKDWSQSWYITETYINIKNMFTCTSSNYYVHNLDICIYRAETIELDHGSHDPCVAYTHYYANTEL